MIETQSSIADWADTTLGKVTNYASCITRAMKEMAELAMCIANDPSDPKAVEEAADVVICLTRLGEHLGADIVEGARKFRLEVKGTDFEACECWAEQAAIDLACLWGSTAHGEPSVWQLERVVANLDGFISSRGKEMRQAIQEKMAINRARTWHLDGHGHGYHVKETTLQEARERLGFSRMTPDERTDNLLSHPEDGAIAEAVQRARAELAEMQKHDGPSFLERHAFDDHLEGR